MMDISSPRPRRRGFAPFWVSAPLLAVLAALAMVAVVARESAGPRPELGAASQPAPYVSSDPSLPDAASLPSLPEPQPHVQAF